MNYLAHLLLSYEQEDLLIGNYLADFVKNKYLSQLQPAVYEGVLLHRKIDSFTDQHPTVSECTKLLHPFHHKYAPVVIDIFFDFFLYQNWNTYCAISFVQFKTDTYQLLLRRLDDIPVPFQARTRSMIEHDWLTSYTSKRGIAYTFERLKKKVSKPEHLHQIIATLERFQDQLNTKFNVFFPVLQAFTNRQIEGG